MPAFVEASEAEVVAVFLALLRVTLRRRKLVAPVASLRALGRLFRFAAAATRCGDMRFSFLKRREPITCVAVVGRCRGAVDGRRRGCCRCRSRCCRARASIEIIWIKFLFACGCTEHEKNRSTQDRHFSSVSHQIDPPEARHFGLFSLQSNVTFGSFPKPGKLHHL